MLKTGFHFLQGLAANLMALKLALCGDDGLDEFSFRRFLELEIETFDGRAIPGQLLAQRKVKLRISGEPLQVVKNYDMVVAWMLAEILEYGDHARSRHEVAPAGSIVVKHGFDCVATSLGVLAASMFLAVQTVSLARLLFARNAAIDYGLPIRPILHCFFGSFPLALVPLNC